MVDAFFVDGDGNKISCEGISSHIGLADEILKKDEKLFEEFKNSKKTDPTDFLVMDKGYMKLVDQGFYYRKCVYSLSKITERQKRLVEYYCYEEGYTNENMDFYKMIERSRE